MMSGDLLFFFMEKSSKGFFARPVIAFYRMWGALGDYFKHILLSVAARGLSMMQLTAQRVTPRAHLLFEDILFRSGPHETVTSKSSEVFQ